jgi:hypothetical protein
MGRKGEDEGDGQEWRKRKEMIHEWEGRGRMRVMGRNGKRGKRCFMNGKEGGG